jgi:hypothetical protein
MASLICWWWLTEAGLGTEEALEKIRGCKIERGKFFGFA